MRNLSIRSFIVRRRTKIVGVYNNIVGVLLLANVFKKDATTNELRTKLNDNSDKLKTYLFAKRVRKNFRLGGDTYAHKGMVFIIN